MMGEYELSIVVACYNMQRELPRTLQTLLSCIGGADQAISRPVFQAEE